MPQPSPKLPCPRCEAQMYPSHDIYGDDRRCVTCGYVEYRPLPEIKSRLNPLIKASREYVHINRGRPRKGNPA